VLSGQPSDFLEFVAQIWALAGNSCHVGGIWFHDPPDRASFYHSGTTNVRRLLALAFLAKSLYCQVTARTVQRLIVFGFGSAAACIFLMNTHYTGTYLSQFRTNLHYNARWSPAIYSLSNYINAREL
jgi:hypothetical protein